MNSDEEAKARRVVPRWRNFITTASTGELKSLAPGRELSEQDQTEIAVKRHEWEENRSLVYAGDFISSAIVLGRKEEAKEAAQFILNAGITAPLALTSLANKVLGNLSAPEHDNVQPLDIRTNIHSLRGMIHQDPRNAIAYVDMSRAYASLGQYKPSMTAMEKALMLQPDNRFVLRSATRLLVHLNESDAAYYYLNKSLRTKQDPWLMAAEIAAATVAGRTSSNMKEALRQLDRHKSIPHQFTELASAVATVEMNNSNTKNARRLFTGSLKDPTENSLAQALWAAIHISNIEVNEQHLKQPLSFEANAREHLKKKEWKEAMLHCLEWLRDEPFSSKPAYIGTFLAISVVNDPIFGRDMAHEALKANPMNIILLNNLVVSYLELNDLKNATKWFDKLPPEGDDLASTEVLKATKGLLHFRRGYIEEGRQLYEEAIVSAKAKGNLSVESFALAYLAREEMLAGTDHYEVTIQKAQEASQRYDHVTLKLFIENVYKLAQEKQELKNQSGQKPAHFRKISTA